jgi:cellulose synthase operon protein C
VRTLFRPLTLGLTIAGFALLATAGSASERSDALIKGTEQLSLGQVRDAKATLTAAVKADPEFKMGYALLARTLLHLGDGAGAERQLKRAISAGYPVGNTHHLMAHALLLQNKLPDALAETTSTDIPVRYATYTMRIKGRIHVVAGEFALATQAYDRALSTGPYSSLLWSDVARFRYITGNVAGAVDATGRALQLDGRNVEALILSGELARGQYGLVNAIPWFERALEFDPNHIGALLELAATLGDAGRTKDMLATTRRVLAIDPRHAHAFYLQAVLAARAGKYDLSRALLYRTTERLDNVPSVILLRAVLDIQADNDTQAIARLKNLIARQPANLKVRRLLGAAQSRSGDHQGAIDSLRPIAMRDDADSYTLTLIGRAYEQMDKRKEAAWFLDRAAQPDRGEASAFEIPTSLTVLARANSENPNNADTAVPFITQLVANGRAGEALAESLRLQRLNKGAPAAHVLVGDSLMALGRTREAIDAYRNAANIRFSEGTALRLVKALNENGEEENALKVLDLYLAQNPRSVPAMLLASDYFMASGQWDKAIITLEKLRGRIGNRDATVLNNLAWAYLSKGDGARGIAYARAAHTITPANPAVSNTYGWALFATGFDKKMGLALLEKAARKEPSHPGLQYRLGQAYVELGRKDDAKRALKAAMASPDFPARKVVSDMLAQL